MIKIQRLTEDSSWHLQWGELSAIIDPWLVGSEIDGTRWINEQWHAVDPVPIDQLPPYDFIVISQPYEDHCHLQTLELLDAEKEIIAAPTAYKKLRKHLPNRTVTNIPLDELMTFRGFHYQSFKPDKWLDPIYFAVLITNDSNEGIFYSPHGFFLKPDQLKAMEGIDFKLLITTFTEFDLPALLGGKVNPGLNNVYQLNEQLQPDCIINTHDEEKLMKGLVGKKAKVQYANYQALEAEDRINFKYIKGYQPVEL